jgi:hypothetical protein
MTAQTFQVISPVSNEIFTYDEATHKQYAAMAVEKWQAAKDALEACKAAEMDCRKWVVAFLHNPDNAGKTETVALDNDQAVKMKVPLKYDFVKDAGGKLDKKAVDKALESIESTGEMGEYIAENLVKWTPTLSLTEYKKLPLPFKKIIDKVIVVSEGTPTVEMVEEK